MLQEMRSAAKYIWVFVFIFFVALMAFEGLMDRPTVSPGDTVAKVNGDDVTYGAWITLTQQLAQQREAEIGRGLTLDERSRVEDEAFEQLVSETLLNQEVARRGIRVTDDEIRQAARLSPPPSLMASPELQTDGQFDPAKYQRFLASPAAQQQGILVQLEAYYRQEIPRTKLFEQVATDAYVSDVELWRLWQDTRDSAVVSYASFRAEDVPDSAVTVSDAELRQWYDANKAELERPGRAAVSVVEILRVVSPADSQASMARAVQVRERVLAGEDFAEVARMESADSLSAIQGGDLGTAQLSAYVTEFADAARALPVGQLSEPILSDFGYHIIRVDQRAGDSASVRHILIPIQQSDSSAVQTDRLADRLANMAAMAEEPARFDSAAAELGLRVFTGQAVEGQRLVVDGRAIPDVSAWAFTGAEVGESSDLIVADEGYFLARLDSLRPGGVPSLQDARDEVFARVAREKKLDFLAERASSFARQAASGTLESAAASANVEITTSQPFTRVTGDAGLGQGNRAIGAAFALPVGAVSAPVRTENAIYVLRVESRTVADRGEWEAQREIQRMLLAQQVRQRRVQDYLISLRQSADVDDNRAVIQRKLRQTQI
ncbi:MAG TPA: peptidyl-prolyl cis-trans isomerase [Gemmatimonadales bacterium]|nr:peptidyl-prolyl cis-trans isomerase [Gemmatimonadales bacterium]